MSDTNENEQKLSPPLAQIYPGVSAEVTNEGAISAKLLSNLIKINEIKKIVNDREELKGLGGYLDNSPFNDTVLIRDAYRAPRQPFSGIVIKIVRPQQGAISTLLNATMRLMRDEKMNIPLAAIEINDQFSAMSVLNSNLQVAPESKENVSGHKIYLIGGEENETGIFLAEQHDDFFIVTLKYRGKEIKAKESDCFSAFSLIRLHLAEEGLIPFCYGASLNVYVTDELRTPGFGLLASKLYPRKKPSIEYLVRIFDTGPDVVPASVEAQEKYWEEWRENSVEVSR